MNKVEKFMLLGLLGVNRTEFQTIPLTQVALEKGIPIGIGECRAVILRLNFFQRNSVADAEQTTAQIYYGDRNKQEFELRNGENSELIICKDLSEVYVRTPYAVTGVNENFVQILIYHADIDADGSDN